MKIKDFIRKTVSQVKTDNRVIPKANVIRKKEELTHLLRDLSTGMGLSVGSQLLAGLGTGIYKHTSKPVGWGFNFLVAVPMLIKSQALYLNVAYRLLLKGISYTKLIQEKKLQDHYDYVSSGKAKKDIFKVLYLLYLAEFCILLAIGLIALRAVAR